MPCRLLISTYCVDLSQVVHTSSFRRERTTEVGKVHDVIQCV